MSYGKYSSVCLPLIFILAIAGNVFSQSLTKKADWKTRIPNVLHPLNERSKSYPQPRIKIISTGHPASTGFQNMTAMYDFGTNKELGIRVDNIPNIKNDPRGACFLKISVVNLTLTSALKELGNRANKIINKANPIELYVQNLVPIHYNILKETYGTSRIKGLCKKAAEQAGVYTVSTKMKPTLTYKTGSLDVLGLIPNNVTDIPKSQHFKIKIPVGLDLTGGKNTAWPN